MRIFAIVVLIIGSIFSTGWRGHGEVSAVTGRPELKIIQDDLYERGNFYLVKGTIYNPNNAAVKNVTIKYYVWKKWMGRDGHGTVIRDTGGLITATIKYLPPKQSVEFVADGMTAPVMSESSGLVPDPIQAEISAEWDR